ncbi:MAG: FAD-dependent thymidylate synthase [Candidatus Syntrophoarchaeum sp.]|nr:FAD-dependent thymidylate synthase [Methanomicrobia archaeon]MBL7117472.1 FAD-dependent thymidylate synthase [Candidatus Syntrophoarchaeum sp.]
MEVKLLRVTEEGIDLVAEAAKVSGVFSTQSAKEIVELIVDNDYSSVLEHIDLTFDISRISVALSRELLEHRIASHTARSTRYMEEKGFGYYVPRELERKGKEEEARIYREAMKNAKEAYTKLRELGIAKEQARYVLPLALHTHYVVTMNVRSLLNFFMLRLCVRAAPEIRELTMRMYKICLEEYPAIFSNIWCRGFTLGVCPENEVRPNECPFKKILPKKQEIKGKFEERAKRIIEKELKTF